MNQALRLCLSLMVSGVFLWLAFRHIDVAAVAQTLRQLRPWPIVLYVLSLVATQIFRALRWHVLVRPFAPVSRWTSWRISNVGNMLILLLPLRLGEFARPYMLRREVGARLTSGIGAAVVERAIDGVLVTLLFFLTTSLLPSQYAVAPALHWGAILALAVFLGASAVLALGLWRRVWIEAILQGLLGRLAPGLLAPLRGTLDAFLAGIAALPDGRAVAQLILWTVAYWVANALGLYGLMCAFGWSVPLLAGFVVVCVLVIGIMVPAGPGFLGTYQAALVAGLSIFDIGGNDALAYSLLAYPLNLAVVLAFGLPHLLGGRTSLHDLTHAPDSEPESGSGSQSPPLGLYSL